MYIIVEKDIVERAINDRDVSYNPYLTVLRAMTMAIVKSHHIVDVPCLNDEENEMADRLSEVMSKREVSILRSFYLSTDRNERHKLTETVITVAVLTTQESFSIRGKKVLVINPDVHGKFNFFSETILLTENLVDSRFYNHLFRYYKKKVGIRDCISSYYPVMGGGATTCKALEYEATEKKHFCLAIVDSDKRWPGGENGSTAENVMKVIEEYEPINCKAYVMYGVREIENLIPFHILKDHECYKQEYDLLLDNTHDAEHFDIKKGINVSDMFDNNERNYWAALFPNHNFGIANQLCQQYPDKKNYQQEARRLSRQDAVIVDISWGSKVLEDIVSKNSHKLDGIKEEQLTGAQKREWFKIGKEIFNWTCSLKCRNF